MCVYVFIHTVDLSSFLRSFSLFLCVFFFVFIVFRSIVSVSIFLCCCCCCCCYYIPHTKKNYFMCICSSKNEKFPEIFPFLYKSFNSLSVYQNNAMAFVNWNDYDDVDRVVQSYTNISFSFALSTSSCFFFTYSNFLQKKNHHGIPLKGKGKFFLSHFNTIHTAPLISLRLMFYFDCCLQYVCFAFSFKSKKRIKKKIE